MASVAKDLHPPIPAEHAESRPEPLPPIADQPMPVAALAVPGLGLGEFGIRPKLTVGNANDPAEVEADRIADGVVAALHGSAGVSRAPASRPGRAVPHDVVPEVGLAGGALSAQLQSAIASARGGGSELPDGIRRNMESALGADLSAVRVHTGPHVEDAAARISARAFTIGSDVFLPGGLPDTASPAGTHLLAHELAHALATASAPSHSSASVGGRAGRSVIRRNGESEKALAGLVTQPIVRPGPTVEVQKDLVKRLEETIPIMEKGRKEALKEHDAWVATFDMETATKEEAEKHNQEANQRYDVIKKAFPQADMQELYLGSIVLNGIPPKEREAEIYDTAQLVPTDNALSPLANAAKLVDLSKTAPLIIQNTLATMITGGQIDYLRKAGFVGAGWQIIVEIHYIRNRPASAASMHKDTLGQTLFVNLNYTNEAEMAGPEFVVNPPLQAEHEQMIEENLPGEFMSDLKYVRGAVGKPKLIQTGNVPEHGVVSFVDEAIHHSTPLIGHRPVSGKNVRLFLQNELPFSDHYQQALTAWTKSREKPAEVGFFGSLFGSKPEPPKSFAELFQVNIEQKNKDMWGTLLSMTQDESVKLERPALEKAGLTEDDVDRLLSQYGPDTFTSAQIPAKARKGGSARAPFSSDVKDRKIVLKREMSQKALAGQLPKAAVKSGKVKEGQFAVKEERRAFFRTWVRAVRVRPAQTPTAVQVNSGSQAATEIKTGTEVKIGAEGKVGGE